MYSLSQFLLMTEYYSMYVENTVQMYRYMYLHGVHVLIPSGRTWIDGAEVVLEHGDEGDACHHGDADQLQPQPQPDPGHARRQLCALVDVKTLTVLALEPIHNTDDR